MTEDDFGGIRSWKKDSVNDFLDYVKDRITECEEYDEIERAVEGFRNMYYAVANLGENEFVVELDYFDYEVHEIFPTEWSYDTHHYLIGVVED